MAIERDLALLKDMIDHAAHAVELSSGRSRRDLDTDLQLRYASERLLEIVGGAAGRVSADFRKRYGGIPWQQIAGLRNRLVHGYGDINLDLIWTILSVDLPGLAAQLKAILRENGIKLE